MQDPYSVLGVSQDATDDEIKQAYRRLAKQYHPDLHPGDAEAARKMNEINAAYDQIKNPQSYQNQSYGGQSYGGQAGRSYGYGDPFGGFGFGGYRQESERTEYQAAEHFIRNRRYQDALNALSQIPQGQRDAAWYYYSGLSNAGLGNRMTALEQLEKAVELDPDDLRYRQALQQMQSGGSVYQNYSSGFNMSSPMSKLCLGLCVANMFCRGCYFFC